MKTATVYLRRQQEFLLFPFLAKFLSSFDRVIYRYCFFLSDFALFLFFLSIFQIFLYIMSNSQPIASNRYWCHLCQREVVPSTISQAIICPQCSSEFIEIIEPQEENSPQVTFFELCSISYFFFRILLLMLIFLPIRFILSNSKVLMLQDTTNSSNTTRTTSILDNKMILTHM